MQNCAILCQKTRLRFGLSKVNFPSYFPIPTVDFESSALNRTQPPFLKTANYQSSRRICNQELLRLALGGWGKCTGWKPARATRMVAVPTTKADSPKSGLGVVFGRNLLDGDFQLLPIDWFGNVAGEAGRHAVENIVLHAVTA